MATRGEVIEMISRDIHAGFPTEDTPITDNLINLWLNQGVAVAAKQNYKDGIAIEGVGYLNNSFYTTFSSLSISGAGQFLWSIDLPQIPIAIGKNEGINELCLVDTDGSISLPLIPLSKNQKGYIRTTRSVPNRTLYYSEGKKAYILSTLLLSGYSAKVTMISSGDFNDFDSTLNVPDDYLPIAIEYAVKKGIMQLNGGVKDTANDGELIK